MNEPTYEELEFPTFVNTCPTIMVSAYDDTKKKETIILPLSDAHKNGLAPKLSQNCSQSLREREIT